MGFFEFLFGNKDKMKQQSLMNPQQEEGLNQFFQNPINKNPLYQSGNNFIQRLLSGDPELMKQFEQPYLNNFNENIAPGIAERFAGMGTGGGASSSSGLQNSLAQAGRGLQSDLAAMRGNMQLQGLNQGLQYAQQPLNNLLAGAGLKTFENTYQPGNQGLLGGVFQGLSSGFSQGFGNQSGKSFFGQPGF